MHRPTATLRTRQQRWWIWLCVAAVLGFQALGLVHRSLHGSASHPSRIAIAQATGEDTPAPAFGHAAGTPDCQLLDQLSHALGPVAQAFAWTAPPPDLPADLHAPRDATLAQLWRKGARGPPLA